MPTMTIIVIIVVTGAIMALIEYRNQQSIKRIDELQNKIHQMEIQIEVLKKKEQIPAQEDYKKKESKNIKIT